MFFIAIPVGLLWTFQRQGELFGLQQKHHVKNNASSNKKKIWRLSLKVLKDPWVSDTLPHLLRIVLLDCKYALFVLSQILIFAMAAAVLLDLVRSCTWLSSIISLVSIQQYFQSQCNSIGYRSCTALSSSDFSSTHDSILSFEEFSNNS